MRCRTPSLHCLKKWTCLFSSILSLKKVTKMCHCFVRILQPESEMLGERVGMAVLFFIEAKNRVINCSRKKNEVIFLSFVYFFLVQEKTIERVFFCSYFWLPRWMFICFIAEGLLRTQIFFTFVWRHTIHASHFFLHISHFFCVTNNTAI